MNLWIGVAVLVAVAMVGGATMAGDSGERITAHFLWRELDPTGKGRARPKIAAALVQVAMKAERLRTMAGVPVSVTPHGGYDPLDGGFTDGYTRASRTSQHHFGTALDLATPKGWKLADWHALGRKQHATEGGGLGLYDWGLHIDTRGGKAMVWNDTSTEAA